MPFGAKDLCEFKKSCIRWGSDVPIGRGTFKEAWTRFPLHYGLVQR